MKLNPVAELTTPPTTSFVSVVPEQNVANYQNISFAFIASESSTFRCSMDRGDFTTCTSPDSLTGLTDGTRTFSVCAVDQIGTQDNIGAMVLVDSRPHCSASDCPCHYSR